MKLRQVAPQDHHTCSAAVGGSIWPVHSKLALKDAFTLAGQVRTGLDVMNAVTTMGKS